MDAKSNETDELEQESFGAGEEMEVDAGGGCKCSGKQFEEEC